MRCFLGLTATATRSTALSVCEHLGIIHRPEAIVRGATIPDNLNLSVSCDLNRDRVSEDFNSSSGGHFANYLGWGWGWEEGGGGREVTNISPPFVVYRICNTTVSVLTRQFLNFYKAHGSVTATLLSFTARVETRLNDCRPTSGRVCKRTR